MRKHIVLLVSVIVYFAPVFIPVEPIGRLIAQESNRDWQQFQHDALRTGRTDASAGSRLRARWIWFGSDWILRNRESEPGAATWNDDLASYDGHNLDMPVSVPFTFAETMQPVVANNTVFVGDHSQNKVWALNVDDGTTLWEADNPGGTAWGGIATDTTVVFASLLGYVTAWEPDSGRQRWQVDTGRSITAAPLLYNDTVYVGNHGGQVYAIDLATGKVNWQSDTGAPIQGGLAAAQGRVFVANDAMYVYAFDASTGQQLARSAQLMGQSFRGLWPVIAGNRVILRTVPVVFVGSEYALRTVIDGSDANFADEQVRLRNWLQSTEGRFSEHLFALNIDDLSKDYVIPNGPVGGVGYPADPPALTWDDQPVTWWPTYFATLSRCSFGCPKGLNVDIASFDLDTGLGIQFPSTAITTSVETDNTFGMTIDGNDTLYLRQSFRGTKAVNLHSAEAYPISAEYRWQNGGGWQSPLNYAEGVQSGPWPDSVVRTPLTAAPLSGGHAGVVILPNRLLFAERFAVVMMESY